jgi:hypothetical protein
MKIPVVLPLLQVQVGADGTLTVDLDHEPYEPYPIDRPLTRADLGALVDEITTACDTAVRVEVHEADGTTYVDIAMPPEPAELAGPGTSTATATAHSDDHATGVRATGLLSGVLGQGFRPGEEVAIAYVLAQQPADAHGSTLLRLPPALLAGPTPQTGQAGQTGRLVLVGLASHVITTIETPA